MATPFSLPKGAFALDGEHCARSSTVFPDGRALLEGTSEIDRARALYDRVLGS